MRALAVVSALLLGSLASACAPAAAPDGPPIAAVHRSQCGKCHAPPAPRSHSREEFESAFGRHQKRVRLTQEEWQAMIDYLAPPAD
jgi:hypothetical protein